MEHVSARILKLDHAPILLGSDLTHINTAIVDYLRINYNGITFFTIQVAFAELKSFMCCTAVGIKSSDGLHNCACRRSLVARL